QLMPAGGDQSDDRGQYRVFALPPGDYYVSATASGLADMLGRGGLQQLAAGLGAIGGGRGGRGGFAGANESTPTGYAPTYYPGVVNAVEAGKVTIGPGQEAGGIDFQIQLVPFATVSGIVGGAEEGAAVLLVPQNANAGGRLGGAALNGGMQADGRFTIPN